MGGPGEEMAIKGCSVGVENKRKTDKREGEREKTRNGPVQLTLKTLMNQSPPQFSLGRPAHAALQSAAVAFWASDRTELPQ